MDQTKRPIEPPRVTAFSAALIVGVLVAATLWSYWPTLLQLAERWRIDPQYSHGFLVPIFAGIILWVRKPADVNWCPNFWGLAVMVVALAPRWYSARMDMTHLDGACLIGSLLGLALLVGGWDVLKWTWPAILFLGFMVPLPEFLNEGIAIPLRRLATIMSTYVLQTFGYPALADGNTIQIEEIRLGVIQACSGLGMLMTFLALATAMALVVPGPIVDRVFLVVSAVPIAVLANVVRITVTGMLYSSLGWQEHREAIHDTLGWLMMPLALLLLWLELRFLRVLLISKSDEAPLAVPLSPWVERVTPTKPKARWS